ncbi:MAG: hypothetical protein Q9214_003555 [Letrouitia sp. 1 TL-2023]
MFILSKIVATIAFVSTVIAAPAPAPAPQAAGEGEPATFGPDSQITAVPQSPAALPYLVIVGAENAPATLAASIPALPPNPTATYYNTEGKPINPMPAPYTPAGGLGTNGTLPRNMWIELDLFYDGLARFTNEQFIAASLGDEARSLIEFMANQETGHATLLTNMLGERAPKQCRVTRFGESGVWGFINHLDSREFGQLFSQSIATESRQQQIFRQISGPPAHECLVRERLAAIVGMDDAGTDGSETVGDRIADPSVSNLTSGSCVNLNATGYGCGPAVAHNKYNILDWMTLTRRNAVQAICDKIQSRIESFPLSKRAKTSHEDSREENNDDNRE